KSRARGGYVAQCGRSPPLRSRVSIGPVAIGPDPRLGLARRAFPTRESGDGFRGFDVFYRLCDVGGRFCAGARGARFRIGVGARALAHSGLAQDPLSWRRRIAKALLRRDGSVRQPDRSGGRDDAAKTRYRRLPGATARPDPDGKTGRLARPGFEWALL